MAIVAYDRSGNEIYAEDVESRGEFICVECEERVSYRRDYDIATVLLIDHYINFAD